MVYHVIIILGLETQCTLQCKSVYTSRSKSYTTHTAGDQGHVSCRNYTGIVTQCILQCKSVSTSLSKSYTQLEVRIVYLVIMIQGYCAMYVCVHLPLKVLHTRTELEVRMVYHVIIIQGIVSQGIVQHGSPVSTSCSKSCTRLDVRIVYQVIIIHKIMFQCIFQYTARCQERVSCHNNTCLR